MPKFHSVVLSTSRHFQDKRFSKIGNAPNDPRITFKHLTVNSTLYTLTTHPDAQILLCFALRPAAFEIQGFRKSKMHRMTPEWPYAINCKRALYTLDTHPRGPNFTPFRSTGARFPANWGFWFPHRVQWWNLEIRLELATQNCKNPKQYFCEDNWEENSGKVWKLQKWFEGGVAFWSFGSHRVPC